MAFFALDGYVYKACHHLPFVCAYDTPRMPTGPTHTECHLLLWHQLFQKTSLKCSRPIQCLFYANKLCNNMDADILDPMVWLEFPKEHPTENEGPTSFQQILGKRTKMVKTHLEVLTIRWKIILGYIRCFSPDYSIRFLFWACLPMFLPKITNLRLN